jgi:hypothetical protein
MEAILPLSGKKPGSVSPHPSPTVWGREVGDDALRRTRREYVTRITNPKVDAATNSDKTGRTAAEPHTWRKAPMTMSYAVASVLLQTS